MINEFAEDIFEIKRKNGFNVTNAMEEFYRLEDELDEARDAYLYESKDDLALELADVYMYLISIAEIEGIDLREAVKKKIDINRTRVW